MSEGAGANWEQLLLGAEGERPLILASTVLHSSNFIIILIAYRLPTLCGVIDFSVAFHFQMASPKFTPIKTKCSVVLNFLCCFNLRWFASDGADVLYNKFNVDSSTLPNNPPEHPNSDYNCVVAITGQWRVSRCNELHRVVCQSDTLIGTFFLSQTAQIASLSTKQLLRWICFLLSSFCFVWCIEYRSCTL